MDNVLCTQLCSPLGIKGKAMWYTLDSFIAELVNVDSCMFKIGLLFFNVMLLNFRRVQIFVLIPANFTISSLRFVQIIKIIKVLKVLLEGDFRVMSARCRWDNALYARYEQIMARIYG